MLRAIGQFLQNSSLFSKLLASIERRQKLNAIFKTVIGKDFATHCELAECKNDTLSVIIDTQTWTTKFRYAEPDFLKILKLQPEFKKITQIRSLVRPTIDLPGLTPNSKKHRPPLCLSLKSANLIKNTAQHIKSEKLKQSLENLAKHV